MTRRQRMLSVVIAAAMLGVACQQPTRFYMLSSVAGDSGATIDTPLEFRVIAVGPVSIPDYVDRPQIVMRESTNQVRLGTFEQWAGALDDMVARVLIEDLTARLPGARVDRFPRVGGPDFDYRVAVEITRFDVNTTGEAVLAASWQIYDRTSRRTRLSTSTTSHAQARGPTTDDRVAALSEALDDLGNAIAQELARLGPEAAPSAARR